MGKKIWIALVIGLLLGALADRAVLFYCHPPRPWGAPGNEKMHSKKMLERLNKKLSLTPEQRQKVERVAQTKMLKLKELRDSVHPQFEKIKTAAQTEIKTILTPEQTEKFEKMIAEHEQHRKKMFEGH